MNPDRLAELEQERGFLLRSLADLEREHDVGDVDDADYSTLRAGYTTRAAQVLRSLAAGTDSLPQSGPRRTRRVALVVAGTLLVGLAAGFSLAGALGQRQPGQSITGGQVNDVAAKLSQAQQLLGTDPPAAIRLYKQVLDAEPDNVEALTYSSWLVVLQGSAQQDQSIIDSGIESLQVVSRIDPTYADAHCFLGIALGRLSTVPDKAAAANAVQECLDNNPPAAMRTMIAGLLDELQSE